VCVCTTLIQSIRYNSMTPHDTQTDDHSSTARYNETHVNGTLCGRLCVNIAPYGTISKMVIVP
jgi:hypothetical protein